MSSIADKLTNAAELLDQAHTGMELIEQISGNTDAKKASDMLAIIAAIAKAVRKGLAGESNAVEVQHEITMLVSGMSSNHSATQGEIDAKFPSGTD